ncbi:MAG: M56 family metallopeptidase [Defluviitaleaceae bacterium]|nr:M56 family metallopeptidase [Defluviitaleaceae bacterium]
MQNFMINLLICSIAMSAIALLYMITTPLLTKRYSEKGCYYAWLIIVVGLIVPFRPQWGSTIISVELPSYTENYVANWGNGAFPFINPTISLPVDETVFTGVHSGISWAWWQISFAIWITGVVLFVAYQSLRHYHFTKMIKRWSESVTDEQALSALESIGSEMGIKRHIPIYQCACVGSPMLIGIISPRILLPSTNLTKDELHFMLKHELVHYKRKDLLCKVLVLITTAIHWFNPIVYLCVRAINVLCETSCDAEVISSADEKTRKVYSEAIIGAAKYQSRLKIALSTNFYGGKKGMKNRILSIMDTSKKKVGAIVLSVAFIFTVGTGFIISANTINVNNHEPMEGITATAEGNVIIDENEPALQGRRSSVLIITEYEEWGLTIEGLYSNPDSSFTATATQNVFFQGRLIRGFSDFGHGVSMSISSFNEGEDIWIRVIRYDNGDIERLEVDTTQQVSTTNPESIGVFTREQLAEIASGHIGVSPAPVAMTWEENWNNRLARVFWYSDDINDNLYHVIHVDLETGEILNVAHNLVGQ